MTETGENDTHQDTYAELLEQALRWKAHTRELKAEPPSASTTWYGHDILGNLWHIENLIDDLPPAILESFRQGHVADIGAADGDLAYFLESLGATVDLIDWPQTNWNGLTGARTLGRRLGSTGVSIHEMDLDRQFDLPAPRYDLVFMLGILYHLKNPFYVLESLSHSSRYCFISTRIARETLDGGVCLEHAPLAYLLDPHECNDDATNFWIFSATGLRRLVHRTGWTILASHRIGDTQNSNPADADHDERMFLALESRHSPSETT